MLEAIFHAWERRIAASTKDRVVRPFEWGLDWIPENGHAPDAPPEVRAREWVSQIMRDTDAFYSPARTTDYALRTTIDGSALLTFPSALTTPHQENNTVSCRYFPA